MGDSTVSDDGVEEGPSFAAHEDGAPVAGGGIYIQDFEPFSLSEDEPDLPQIVLIESTTIEANHAAIAGGGLAVDAAAESLDVVITGSTIADNGADADREAGGVNAVGIDLRMAVVNSTLSGNRGGVAGAMQLESVGPESADEGEPGFLEVVLDPVTVLDNEDALAEADSIHMAAGPDSAAEVTLRNSIVENPDPDFDNCVVYVARENATATIISQGGNGSNDTSCFDADADQNDAAPVTNDFGPLQPSPAGTVPTHTLVAGTEAIDEGVEDPAQEDGWRSWSSRSAWAHGPVAELRRPRPARRTQAGRRQR